MVLEAVEVPFGREAFGKSAATEMKKDPWNCHLGFQ